VGIVGNIVVENRYIADTGNYYNYETDPNLQYPIACRIPLYNHAMVLNKCMHVFLTINKVDYDLKIRWIVYTEHTPNNTYSCSYFLSVKTQIHHVEWWGLLYWDETESHLPVSKCGYNFQILHVEIFVKRRLLNHALVFDPANSSDMFYTPYL
jgi:hypothetical protein